MPYKAADGDCGLSAGTGQPAHTDADCANNNGPGNYQEDNDCSSAGQDGDCGTPVGGSGQLVNIDGDDGDEPA